jgi:hypothetical protein
VLQLPAVPEWQSVLVLPEQQWAVLAQLAIL